MYFDKEDEKPIIDNLLRAYRAPREGADQPGGPDFDLLLQKLRERLGTAGGAGKEHRS